MKKAHASHPLYRLIYCSRRVSCPRPNAPDGELRLIEETARHSNDLVGITSALLFTGSGYAQALEGPRDAVERVFEQIAEDKRHTEVTVLSFAPTERRRFSANAMTVVAGLPPGVPDPIDGLKPDPARDRPRLTTGGDVLRLIEAMVSVSAAVTAG